MTSNTIIRFKAKAKQAIVHHTKHSELKGWHLCESAIQIPKLSRKHLVKASRSTNGFTNSDMLPSVLDREVRAYYGTLMSGKAFSLDDLPPGIAIVDDGFLKTIEITVPDLRGN